MLLYALSHPIMYNHTISYELVVPSSFSEVQVTRAPFVSRINEDPGTKWPKTVSLSNVGSDFFRSFSGPSALKQDDPRGFWCPLVSQV